MSDIIPPTETPIESYYDKYLEEDCATIDSFVRSTKPNKLLEIGSGQTTLIIAQALKDIFEESKSTIIKSDWFVSVDTDKHRLDELSKSLIPMNPQGVSIVNSDSIAYMSQFCQRNTYDFIFIDSSHTLEQTLLELNFALVLLSPTGRIFLHDTKMPTVISAIYILLSNIPNLTFLEYNTHYGLGELKYK